MTLRIARYNAARQPFRTPVFQSPGSINGGEKHAGVTN